MWLDDLATVLVNAGVGTLGVSIFLSSHATVPVDVVTPFISLFETQGLEPQKTQNSAPAIAYEQPGAQVVARGIDYVATRTMAKNAFNALTVIQNQEINSIWYMRIAALQMPFDMGPDADTGRTKVGFNILAVKRPS